MAASDTHLIKEAIEVTDYVYAALYDERGLVLIARKRQAGYYFGPEPGQGGRIVQAGQVLHGAGRSSLPGGKKRDDESILFGAAREFHEETGVEVDDRAIARATPWRHDQHDHDMRFAGGLFRVSSQVLDATARRTNINLIEGDAAADEIRIDEITEYDDIHQYYPHAPADNELDVCGLWNLHNRNVRAELASWRGDPDLGWFYYILSDLSVELNLGPLSVLGADEDADLAGVR
ncbi:NUDIX hydrolase [Dactylosporangium sp. NPDC051541]|uniref:NUDIX hydrolase n=1 Tax=Dactylosporangium sp. NPDC051541 TaxID=3363977 RepID=UPI0037A50D23